MSEHLKQFDLASIDTEDTYIIYTQFCNSKKKDYKYYIKGQLLRQIACDYNVAVAENGSNDVIVQYYIENSFGHNYNHNPVYFTNFTTANLIEDYKAIVKLEFNKVECNQNSEIFERVDKKYFYKVEEEDMSVKMDQNGISFTVDGNALGDWLTEGEIVLKTMDGRVVQGKATDMSYNIGYCDVPTWEVNFYENPKPKEISSLGEALDEWANKKGWPNWSEGEVNRIKEILKEDEEKIENKENLNYNNNTLKEKEKNTMFENVFKGMNFGKIKDGSVRMSVFGPAFASYEGDGKTSYVAYDKSKNTYVDVADAFIDFDFMYEIPVAAASIAVGDFIRHQNRWCRVISVANGRLEVEKIYGREIVTVMPITNIFGYNFYQKLCAIDIMGNMSNNQPFGNMLPFMMMSNGDDSKEMLIAMMLMNGGMDIQSNPMALMMLMGNQNNDMLNMFMMMNLMGQNPFGAIQQNTFIPTYEVQSRSITDMDLTELEELTDMINIRLGELSE